MDKNILPKVEDYVFLSAPNSGAVFIVQRSGEIWMQDGTEDWSVSDRKFDQAFLNWKKIIDGECHWSWLSGWLPVFQIKNDSGKQISLLAKNNVLWIKNEKSVTSYPDKTPIPAEEFEEEVKKLTERWDTWIASGWTPPAVHPYIDTAWKASFVQVFMAYSDKHPHYGVAYYGRSEHDAFLPTTLSIVSALLEYGHVRQAQELLSYFLRRYILPDGNNDYYGTAISELGGLLALSAQMLNYKDGADWLKEHLNYLNPVFYNLVRMHNPVSSQLICGLIPGAPEADERKNPGAYFHNNAFVWRAFSEWGNAMERLGFCEAGIEGKRNARELKRDIEEAILRFKLQDGLLPSRIDKEENFKSFTGSRDAAYANYRYYPELLETGILPETDAYAIIKAREEMNGEVCGMTYLMYGKKEPRFDNWPLASYARGLLELGDKERFMRAFVCHALFHQTQDTFTAYEQVSEKQNPRRAAADWCIPCQLVLPRMLAWSFRYKKWDGSEIRGSGPDMKLFKTLIK